MVRFRKLITVHQENVDGQKEISLRFIYLVNIKTENILVDSSLLSGIHCHEFLFTEKGHAPASYPINKFPYKLFRLFDFATSC